MNSISPSSNTPSSEWQWSGFAWYFSMLQPGFPHIDTGLTPVSLRTFNLCLQTLSNSTVFPLTSSCFTGLLHSQVWIWQRQNQTWYPLSPKSYPVGGFSIRLFQKTSHVSGHATLPQGDAIHSEEQWMVPYGLDFFKVPHQCFKLISI